MRVERVSGWLNYIAKRGVLNGWHKGTHAHHNIIMALHICCNSFNSMASYVNRFPVLLEGVRMLNYEHIGLLHSANLHIINYELQKCQDKVVQLTYPYSYEISFFQALMGMISLLPDSSRNWVPLFNKSSTNSFDWNIFCKLKKLRCPKWGFHILASEMLLCTCTCTCQIVLLHSK